MVPIEPGAPTVEVVHPDEVLIDRQVVVRDHLVGCVVVEVAAVLAEAEVVVKY